MNKAHVIDDGDDQIIVFPPGYLDGVEEVRIEQRPDGLLLLTPVEGSAE